MKKLLIGFLVFPFFASAQVVIPATAILATAKNSNVVMQTSGDIANNSTYDFTDALLRVNLNGATQVVKGNFVISDLSLNGAGTKTHTGSITVTNSIDFTKGYVVPSPITAKFLFIGPEQGITGGSDESFFDCTTGGSFYSAGDGSRLFPIGAQFPLATGLTSMYTPSTLESITAETGMSVKAGSSLLTYDTSEIFSIDPDRYWTILPGDASSVNGKVELSIAGLDQSDPGATTIVQASSLGGQAENLGSSVSNASSIKSRVNVTAGLLAIGKEKTITVRVHDLITPTGSAGVNDKLYIENIDKFDHKKVTLLDRWGYVIHEWKDFSNETDYDFTKLAPGNYIAVVEYGNEGEKRNVVQQMVTVLKIN